MRLAFITQDFLPEMGGIQTYSYELSQRLQSKCEYFIVVAPKVKGSDETDSQFDCDILRVKTINNDVGYITLPRLPFIFKEKNIDTVFHAQWHSLPVSILAKKLGLINNIFLACHGREFFFNPFKNVPSLDKIYLWYRNSLLKFVDHFFAVSHFTKDLLCKLGINEDKISVVINGTDPDKFHPKPVPELKKKWGLTGKKVLLTVSRLESRKGVDTVLKSLPLIKDSHPNLKYLIVGDGSYKDDLKKMSMKLNLEDIVIFTERIPYEMVNDYYNLCDIFVMPSKTELPDIEAFGIVYLEANSCGKPVIGTKTGGIPSAVIDGETGFLVEEKNTKELASIIDKLLKNEDLAKNIGEKGRERVLNEANWDVISEKLYRKMEQIII